MRTLIREQAEFMGYEISPADIEGIIEAKFHLIVTGNIRVIRAAIRAWFED